MQSSIAIHHAIDGIHVESGIKVVNTFSIMLQCIKL